MGLKQLCIDMPDDNGASMYTTRLKSMISAKKSLLWIYLLIEKMVLGAMPERSLGAWKVVMEEVWMVIFL